MAEFGRGVDELDGNLLLRHAVRLLKQRLAQSHQPLTRAADATLDHEVIVLDDAVVGETTHGCDVLLGGVVFGGGFVGRFAFFADAIDFLVDFGAVVVAVLTGSRDGEGDARWVPRADASNLVKTAVRLAGEAW